ncbi:RES family NAD+ phosphorylase [Rheinheimera hassiensis]|uniref:RES family NAD+ phosphorylase n=1 Tax=Rheinheimera hassiensis TaxID=1193627 RepID=UPI001F060595|nr:RES family NAD+ phosphorylase [Rheinheimera hassiensis]
MNKTGRNNITDKLNSLCANNELPLQTITAGQTLFRMQGTGHAKGFHYHAPTANLGRYNDPNAKLGICYVSSQADVAIGEIILRTGKTELDKSELELSEIAQLTTKKDLKVLNVGRLLPKLGLKLDELSSTSYGICQEIVRYFSDNPNPAVQGIIYISRHLADGECYALFAPAPGEVHLETISKVKLSDFKCAATGLDAEEILTDVLNVDVTDVMG